MKPLGWLILFLMVLSPLAAESAFVPVTDLIEQAKTYDGKQVSLAGEVIGDVMVRGDHAWVHLSDGVNALGLWLPKPLALSLAPLGDYNHRGPEVKVTGIFYRACTEHLGETDLHLENLTVLTPGHLIHHPVTERKVKTALVLFPLAVLFFLWEYFLLKKVLKT